MVEASRAKAVAWTALATAAVLNLIGYIGGLWSGIGWFDEFVHGYTTFAVTLAVGVFAYGRVLVGRQEHAVLLVLTIAALGLALGALWEMAEWIYDQLKPANTIKGKTDTIVDLFMDTAGALVAALLCLPLLRQKT